MSHIRIDKFMTPNHDLLYQVKNSTEAWANKFANNPDLNSQASGNRFGTAAYRLLQNARKTAKGKYLVVLEVLEVKKLNIHIPTLMLHN